MLLLVLILFAFGHCQSPNYEVSENCGAAQSCVIISDCPQARDALRRFERPKLKRCGWAGVFELFCCPRTEEKPTAINTNGVGTANMRKSAQACVELSNEVIVQVEPQILGGTDAKAGEFPHMAALGYDIEDSNNVEWKCGGSLISKQYVLTAAHCIVRQDGTKPRIIRLGKIDILGNRDGLIPQDHEVDKFIVHPQYEIKAKHNDIALIRLRSPVVFDVNVQPACLYNEDDAPINLMITGWGLINGTGPNSDILQKAEVTPADLGNCNSTYNTGLFPLIIRHTQICAMSKNETTPTDTCTGDSGGPLQFRSFTKDILYKVVGVTSFGDNCGGGRNIPSVYTRVSSYLGWIESIVWS